MKTSNTKKRFVLSLVVTVVSVAMLVGATFAWFTDSVSSAGNRIQAGTLKVDLLMDKGGDDYESIAGGQGDIFKEADVAQNSNATLWEPGKTQIVKLAVENKGNLAIKYNMLINVQDEGLVGSLEYAIFGTGHTKPEFDSSGKTWADIKAIDGVETDDVTEGVTVAAENGKLDGITQNPSVENERDYFILAVHMKEEAGNEYQGKDILIDVTVMATQATAEEDAFDDQYDKAAVWDGNTPDSQPASYVVDENGNVTLKDAAALAYFAGQVNSNNTYPDNTVTLDCDINLGNLPWTPIGNVTSYPSTTFAGTFDGNGKTIYNLYAKDTLQNHATAGLFGSTTGTIKNVNLKNVNVVSTHYAGAIVGYSSDNTKHATIENCTVDGGTITSTPEKIGDEYDNGDKVGGIMGYAVSGDTITGCTVKNVTVKAYRDLGGIIGCANTGSIVKNNAVFDSTIIQDDKNAYKTNITTYDKIIGNDYGAETENNTATNVTIKRAHAKPLEAKNQNELDSMLNNAVKGDTVKLIGKASFTMPTQLNKNITISGNGKDTVLKVNENSKIKESVSFENMTIATCTNTQSTDGAINITGDAKFKNVTIEPLENQTPKYAITVSGTANVVFENVDFALDGKTRGIMVWGGSPKVYVKNCKFDCVYPFNVDGGTPEFIVTDSVLNGWTSYTNTSTASFTNCKFGKSTSGYAYCRPYSNATFTKCEFSSDFLIDFGAAGITITLNQCKQNSVGVTQSIIEPNPQSSGTLVIDGTSYPITKK